MAVCLRGCACGRTYTTPGVPERMQLHGQQSRMMMTIVTTSHSLHVMTNLILFLCDNNERDLCDLSLSRHYYRCPKGPNMHSAPSLCTIAVHHRSALSQCTITVRHRSAPSQCTITVHHHCAPSRVSRVKESYNDLYNDNYICIYKTSCYRTILTAFVCMTEQSVQLSARVFYTTIDTGCLHAVAAVGIDNADHSGCLRRLRLIPRLSRLVEIPSTRHRWPDCASLLMSSCSRRLVTRKIRLLQPSRPCTASLSLVSGSPVESLCWGVPASAFLPPCPTCLNFLDFLSSALLCFHILYTNKWKHCWIACWNVKCDKCLRILMFRAIGLFAYCRPGSCYRTYFMSDTEVQGWKC